MKSPSCSRAASIPCWPRSCWPRKYDKVHLVTFDKGYLEFGVKNNQPNVELLKPKIGADRITHQVIDIKNLHKAISVRFFFKERKKYNYRDPLVRRLPLEHGHRRP